MLLTPHTLVGVTVASAIPNPFIAIPVAFALHFLGDSVPHWDFFSNTPKEDRLKGWRLPAVIIDFGVGLAVGLIFTLHALWVRHDSSLALNIFLCSAASTLPDALEIPHIFMGANDPFTRFVLKIQHRMQFQAPLPWGLISQAVVILVCLVLLLGL